MRSLGLLRPGTIVILTALAFGAALASACQRDPRLTSSRHVRAGDDDMAKHRYREATIEYRGAIQAVPGDGRAHQKLSAAYLAAGDAFSALRELVRAAEQLPGDNDVQLEASRALLAAGRFTDAKARVERLLARDPRNVGAQIVLGNALAGLQELDHAITEIDSAIDLDPRRSLSYVNRGSIEAARGDRAAAEAAFLRAVDLDPRSVPALLALANFHWSAGRIDETEHELTRAVALDPHNPAAQRALAAFYIGTHRVADAEAPLRAVADATISMGPKLILADYYRDTGRADRALDLLSTIAKDREWFAAATMRIAAIRFHAGAPADAQRAIDAVLARNARDARAQLLKASFLASEMHFADALAHARAATTSDPRSAAAYFLEGSLLARLGQPEQAIRAWETVITLRPGDVQALTAVARLHAARGDWASVELHAQTAVNAAPGNADAHLLLARALTERGDLRAAEPELAMLSRQHPQSGPVQYALGRFYLASHDRRRAREALTRAMRVNPDDLLALGDLTDLDVAERHADEALARIEARLEQMPGSAPLLVLAARVHEAIGHPADEESALREATANDPSNLDAYRLLARLYIRQRRLEDATQEFEQIAARNHGAVGARTMAGILLELEGRPVLARVQYEQALAVNPRAGIAANNLAWLLAETGGNLDIALQLAQTAKAALPDQPEVDDTLGWIYYRKGLVPQALTFLRESVALNPADAASARHLAIALKSADR